MKFGQSLLLAFFAHIATGCVDGLQEVYELKDTRIIGMQASPPELALSPAGDEVVSIKPFIYLPESITVTSSTWSFCPFAAGGELGYRCFLEECLTDVSDSVNESGVLVFEPIKKAFECLDSIDIDDAAAGGDAGGVDSSDFEQLPTQVRLTIETSDGQVREAIKRIPIWLEEPQVGLNRNPTISSVSIGSQRVTAGGDVVSTAVTKTGEGTFERLKIDLELQAVAESFDQYVAGETTRREDAQWTLFVTEGNLGVVGNRLVGDSADGEWALEPDQELPEQVELWIALRDGRTGQSIDGPFYFTPTN